MDKVPARLYTHVEVQHARTKGQVVGWIQGGLVAIGGWWLLGLVGWLPVILLVGVVGIVVAKMLFGRKP